MSVQSHRYVILNETGCCCSSIEKVFGNVPLLRFWNESRTVFFGIPSRIAYDMVWLAFCAFFMACMLEAYTPVIGVRCDLNSEEFHSHNVCRLQDEQQDGSQYRFLWYHTDGVSL